LIIYNIIIYIYINIYIIYYKSQLVFFSPQVVASPVGMPWDAWPHRNPPPAS
jgi:hypothetical protein